MKIRIGNMVALVVGIACLAGGALRAQISDGPQDAVPHASSGVVEPPATGDAQMSRQPQGADAEFVDKAALAGHGEVEASQIALQRSSTPAVRAFAKQMVADHGKANRRLSVLAERAGVPVSAARIDDPDIDALHGMSGRDFDIAYLAVAGPDAHRKAIALFEDETRDGQSSALRGFANATLPTLRHHLAMAQALAQQVGAN